MSEAKEKKGNLSRKFSPEQRILKEWLFKRVVEKGKFVKGQYFNLWVYTDAESVIPRLGVIVGKNVSLRANVRNLWKRRMREAFRNNQDRIKCGALLVLKARKTQQVPTYQEMLFEFEKLLEKAGSVA